MTVNWRADGLLAERRDEWFTPGRFAIILALCIFAAYPGVLLGLETFYYRDFGFFGYPLAHYHRESFWHGEIPLWNPLSNCGLPFLAQWNTLVLYPGSLFYLLFPLSWSLDVAEQHRGAGLDALGHPGRPTSLEGRRTRHCRGGRGRRDADAVRRPGNNTVYLASLGCFGRR